MQSVFKAPHFFKKPYFKFIAKQAGPFNSTVTLDRNRVYILPTKSGLVFSLLLLILLVGSVNYDKSLGFVLTFLLVGIGNVALLQTWKNLAGLKLSAGGSHPVFAGNNARFTIQLENTDHTKKYAISICHNGKLFETTDVENTKSSYLHFDLKTKKRGYLNPKQIRIQTEFPTGLFISWTIIDLSMQCLVYPSPSEIKANTINTSVEEGGESLSNDGTEEYTGLKKYQTGESWRRISWKAMARNNELYTKEFSGGQPQQLWIDWNDIQEKDIEKKISLLTQMVIDANSKDYHYGLRLPEVEIAPDIGNAHYHQCLKQLALYGI